MTAVAYLSRRYRFSASHRLHVDSLSDEQNKATFGKCNNPHGHGHNYIAQLTFRGAMSSETGMITNLADLDQYAQRELLDVFDHTNLNTLECFREVVPSTENVCLEIWQRFVTYPFAKLVRVHVEETGNNSFDYFGNKAPSLLDA